MADKFDCIIVGGGVAGSTAGYMLARVGLEVLIVERGNFSGAKNMTGGRLYSHSLESIFPDFAQSAPVERKVTREKVSFMTQDSAVTMDFQSDRLGFQSKDSYVVLRSQFDRWLADQAEEAGAMVASGILVDELLVRDGRVVGIKAGEDEMEADVVILADGVNSLLAQQIGMRNEIDPHHVAVGAKEVIELPPSVIEDRFNLNGDEGAAWLFAGACSDGMMGGGYLYTNKESISLGLVIGLGGIGKSEYTVPELLENFKQHPIIKPLIKGGKLVEYSGHVVPEGGYNAIPKLFGDGVMVVGDAAGLVINTGYMVRGMDLAIASAEMAARAFIEAKERNDFSADSLSCYQKKLEQSFVIRDMKLYKDFPAFMENPRIFNEYPELAAGLLTDLFRIDGVPNKSLKSKAFSALKKVGLVNLTRDAWKGVNAL